VVSILVLHSFHFLLPLALRPLRLLRSFALRSFRPLRALHWMEWTGRECEKTDADVFVCSDSLSEMLGDLFLPRDMPEAPKQSFFKNLFNLNAAVLDREQLCKLATSWSYLLV